VAKTVLYICVCVNLEHFSKWFDCWINCVFCKCYLCFQCVDMFINMDHHHLVSVRVSMLARVGRMMIDNNFTHTFLISVDHSWLIIIGELFTFRFCAYFSHCWINFAYFVILCTFDVSKLQHSKHTASVYFVGICDHICNCKYYTVLLIDF